MREGFLLILILCCWCQDVASDCSYNCSWPAGGECIDNKCVCKGDRTPLADCRYPNIDVVLNSNEPTISQTLDPSSWLYFNAQVPPSPYNELMINVQYIVSTGQQTPILYCKDNAQSLPSNANNDFSNATSSATSVQLSVVNPTTGTTWFCGLYSQSASLIDVFVMMDAAVQCPQNCSQRGFCDDSTSPAQCKCEAPFAGDSCSYQYTELPSGGSVAPVPVQLLPRSWAYFSLSVFSVSQSLLTVNAVGAAAPLQVFIGATASQLPNQINYDYRWNTGSGPFSLAHPAIQKYVIGFLNGDTAVQFNASAKLLEVCPRDCSSHGTCDSSKQNSVPVCDCDAGWQPPDCSAFNQQVDSAGNATGKLSSSALMNYYFPLPANTNSVGIVFNCTVQQLPLYLGWSRPSPTSYDVVLLADGAAVLTLDQPAARTLYLAVAEGVGAFQIQLTPELVCPNNCSVVGTCDVTGECRCPIAYTLLPDCSLFEDSLENNVTSVGLVGADPHFFHFQMNNSNASQVLITLETLTLVPSNLLLYLAYDSRPSLVHYDLRTVTPALKQRLVVSSIPNGLRSGQWNLGVFPQDDSVTEQQPYSLSYETVQVCINDCSQHGDCIDSKCQCHDDWVLDDCSATEIPIVPDTPMSGQASPGVWQYYALVNVNVGDALLVQLDELATVGRVWLYIAHNAYPTSYSYLDSSTTSSSAVHSLTVRSSTKGNDAGVWRIGVVGSPNLGYKKPTAPYSLRISTGCQTYVDCELCAQDSGCGWCFTSAFNTSEGRCLAGNEHGSNTGGCIAWGFATCETTRQRSRTIYIGLAIGISVGLVVVIGVAVAGLCFSYKNKTQRRNLLADLHADLQ